MAQLKKVKTLADTTGLALLSPTSVYLIIVNAVGIFSALETEDAPDDDTTFASLDSGWVWEKIFAGSASGGGGEETFSELSGTAWDFATAKKVSKELTGSTAITISNSEAGKSCALLFVTQDATGSRVLSINGTVIDINTDPESSTLIGVVDAGGGVLVFDTSASAGSGGGGGGGGSSFQDLIFSTANGLSQSGTQWSGTVGSSWSNFGKATKMAAAGLAVEIQAEYPSTDGQPIIVGFNAVDESAGYPNMEAGFYIAASGQIGVVEAGTPSFPFSQFVSAAAGTFVRMKRSALGAFTLFKVVAGVETFIYTFTYTGTADMWINGVVFGTVQKFINLREKI